MNAARGVMCCGMPIPPEMATSTFSRGRKAPLPLAVRTCAPRLAAGLPRPIKCRNSLEAFSKACTDSSPAHCVQGYRNTGSSSCRVTWSAQRRMNSFRRTGQDAHRVCMPRVVSKSG
eukprot:1157784-Pelagomonas_calceolata.AAC.7